MRLSRPLHPSLILLAASAANALAATATKPVSGFVVQPFDDRLVITDGGQPVAIYTFKEAGMLRPGFQNVHAPGGVLVTRRHPPAAPDLVDHPTMHPGIWFAFGSINGEDFWRNKASVEHERFTEPPAVKNGVVSFVATSRLVTAAGQSLGSQIIRVSIARKIDAYLFDCETTLKSDTRDLAFGDQEEMGFGVRLATPLIEKNGGAIVNSGGLAGARRAWGQLADWCSYSRVLDGRAVGVAIFASPKNPQRSWWHTRDYGLMVANPFGKRVLPAGSDGNLIVPRGVSHTLRFGVLVFNAPARQEMAAAYRAFVSTP